MTQEDLIEFLIIVGAYLVMAILTAIAFYARVVKEYVKEKPNLRFKYWIENQVDYIFMVSIFWFAAIPTHIICFFAKKITERINKHYGVK